MRRVRLTLLLPFLLAFLGLAAPAVADMAFVPPMPQDFSKVDVYLITVKRGDEVYALYGHTILRVVDRARGQDLNFNWGIFDFDDPRFVWNFYRGDLNYMMVISEFTPLVDHYREIEKRGMVMDRIVLTAKQKETLMRRLIDNAQPEHVHYQYDQFRDNCSTKPRDHLDFALGGHLKEMYQSRAARLPLRHYIKSDGSPQWWVHMGLDTLSNDRLDRKVTAWDEMFLPQNLRDLLLDAPALDDDGNPILGHNLLEDHQVIVDLPEPGEGPDPYMMLTLLLGFPMLAGALALAGRPPERRAAVVLGLMSLAFGLWSAVWGTVMASNWLVSHYLELQHNAALWLFWPVDWLFALFGLSLLFRRSRPSRLQRLPRLVTFTASAHLSGLVLLAVLWLAGVVHQNVLPVLASTGAIGLVYYGSVIRYAAAREP